MGQEPCQAFCRILKFNLRSPLLATNCGPTLVQPTITRLARIGTINAVSFTTVTGQAYALEFKNALANGNWNSVGPSTAGSGAVVTLTDTAGLASRFYRVRAQ